MCKCNVHAPCTMHRGRIGAVSREGEVESGDENINFKYFCFIFISIIRLLRARRKRHGAHDHRPHNTPTTHARSEASRNIYNLNTGFLVLHYRRSNALVK